MKWGRKYGPEFVNALVRGVARRLSPPYRFLCLTDDPGGLDAGIETAPMPIMPMAPAFQDRRKHGEGWRKLSVMQRGLADLDGPVLFLDIDVAITGDLDRLFAFEPGRFCIIRDWLEIRRRPFRRLFQSGYHPQADSNSSVFRYEMPRHAYVYDHFMANQSWADRTFRLSQQYVGAAVGDRAFWPASWVVSFKRSCIPAFPLNLFQAPKPPPAASVLVFHGHPDPDEALAGYSGSVFRRTRPAEWLAADWN